MMDTPRSGPLKATVWIDGAIAVQQTLSSAQCDYEWLSRMSLGAFCPDSKVTEGMKTPEVRDPVKR